MADVRKGKLTELRPDKRNANRGTKRGLAALDHSIRQYGVGRGIVVDKNGTIIGGNKTVERLADLGIEDIVVVPTDGKTLVVTQRTDLDLETDKAARELAYHDNRVGQLDLEWEPQEITLDLANGIELGDLFTDKELQELGVNVEPEQTPADPGADVDRAEELGKKWQTVAGQIWKIADHYVICGDCRDPDTWKRLLEAAGVDKVNGVFTSPPYAEQSKEQYGGIAADKYVEWWEGVQANVRANIAGDGSFFVNIKAHSDYDGEKSLYVLDLVIAHARLWNWSFVDEFCWLRGGVPREVKYNFKNGFEPVFHFAATKKGFKFRPDDVRHESDSVPVPGGPGIGNTNWAGKQGKSKAGAAFGRTLQGNPGGGSQIFGTQDIKSGMAYPSNVIKAINNDEGRGHQAAFPVGLPEFFIKAYSDPSDIWLDPFCGSGTTIVAAHQNGRRGLGIELLPKYMGVILERLQEVTGCNPVLLQN